MGAGYHGGFGATVGSKRNIIVTADSSLTGNHIKGKILAAAAKKVKKEEGYTDVAVHGGPDHVAIFRIVNGQEYKIVLSHRALARFLKSDSGYTGGNIRLLSCKTGSKTGVFAQNLANKLGVVGKAPSDTLHIWHSGQMVIDTDAFTNSGEWITYYPQKRKKV